ncbi:type IV secretion system protein [Erwinia papayae]|uniref:Type IV secretion system protein n=1 Tax=Erwinia papayae TaxID=206499 RepID=A0ABV3N7K7_9GAMM
MSGFTVVTTLFNTIDKVLNTMVTSNVSTIITQVTPVVAALLTTKLIVMALFSAFRPGEGEPISQLGLSFIYMALVLSFATAGGFYQTDLVNLAMTLPDSFATQLKGLSSTNYTGIAGLIDGSTTTCIEAIKTQFDGAGITASGLMSMVIGCILLAATIVITGLGAGFVLMAKVLLAVTLCLGPIAIFCLLWNPVKGIFGKWLGSVINYSLVIIVLALVFSLLMTLFGNMIKGFVNGAGLYDALSTVLGMSILTVVAVLVLFQVPQLAASFGSGIQAHIGDAARSAFMSGSQLGRMSGMVGQGVGGKGASGGGGAGTTGGSSNPSQSSSSSSGPNLSGKARGSRGRNVA